MLRHNLILIYRSLKKDRSTFLINLIGLSSGLACALLIFFWINDELGVDKFHEKDRRLYQVLQTDGIETQEATPAILAASLLEEIPEVEYAVSVVPPSFNSSRGVISVDDVKIKSVGQYVSKDYFNLFTYKLIQGKEEEALSSKNGMVISEALAVKLFTSAENALGKTLEWNSQTVSGACFVSGVFESPPSNATVQFDFLLSYEWFEEFHPAAGWGSSSPRTYVVLEEEADYSQVDLKINDYVRSKNPDSNSTFFLQQYSSRYLYGTYENGKIAGGRIEYIRLFSIIGGLLLIIACINFMNLSTAKASRKIKEVGVKKAMGADRKSLVIQYLGESVMMAFIALIVSLVAVKLLLPQFSYITGKSLELDLSSETLFILVGFTVFTGLLSGSYPALVISGFKPSRVLKGKIDSAAGGEVWIRKGLVFFQFAVAVILMVFVWVVYSQIDLIQSKDLGYARDQVVYFDVDKPSGTFLGELRNIPGVVHVGGGNMVAGKSLGNTNDLVWEGKSPDQNILFSNFWVSYGLIETLGMEVVAGHPFSEDFGATDQLIFNESAIEKMNMEDPVGKRVTINGEERQIVGVVRDFHFESLYEEVKPCAVLLAPMEYAPRISVKIESGSEKAVLASIKNVYGKHMPGVVFDFKFMDEDYQAQYVAEQRVSILSGYFSVFTILISCLGLFGLAAFTAEKRVKEIGIRKVLGASEWKIIALFTRDFAAIVTCAVVVALPLSYYLSQNWLSGFVYRIDLEWWYFAGVGMLTLIIALLTVSFQSVKAALMNPVESLQNE